jgi:hypothetical protein
LKTLIIFTFLILGCKEEIQKTRPEQYFTNSQEESILKQIVKKTAKKPEGLSSESDIEAYYNLQTKHYIWHFTHEKNGGFYFCFGGHHWRQFSCRDDHCKA